MKKNNKGFTLIELLAIIVILAIIAVITVPIILNIIENSRMGAATDSAYGYEDAVNKWFVSKLQDDNQYQLASSYTISSDGKLGDILIPVSGDKPSGGYLNYSNNTLTGGCLVFGDYAVSFDEKGNVDSTVKGNCSSTPVLKNGTTVADITVSDYGKYVDIGTNLLGKDNTTEADWRVFYKDTNGAWLILADYLPVNSGTGASVVSAVGLEKEETYVVYSDVGREDLVSKLNGNWSSLIAGSNLYENNNLINNNIVVKGAVDFPTWVASWNENEYTSLTLTQDETVYRINGDDNEVDLSQDEGYDNTLYFPHQSDVSECYGDWLASLSDFDNYGAIHVDISGYVGHYYDDYTSYGVRPAVYLPNNISLNTTETVWTIAE